MESHNRVGVEGIKEKEHVCNCTVRCANCSSVDLEHTTLISNSTGEVLRWDGSGWVSTR